MTVRRRPGRPPFKPTAAKRQKVMLYVAGGMSEAQIAHVIGCCEPTLRKHFADELANGRARKYAENLELLRKAAVAGNVTAMKHLDQKMRLPSDDEFARAPERPKGKKEERAEQARAAGQGSDWADDLSFEPSAVN